MVATFLHFAWAGLITIDSAATSSTPLSLFSSVNPWIPIFLLTISGILTAFVLLKQVHPSLASFVIMAPQHALISTLAFMSFHAIYLQQYADGVERPFTFIAADQIIFVAFATVYGLSYWISHWSLLWESWKEGLEIVKIETSKVTPEDLNNGRSSENN